MTAAPLPKPDGETAGGSSRDASKPSGAESNGASHDDGWALLDSMRRRLDEQAGQSRKTQAQVTQLADSIGALVEVQRRRLRWLNINSFVAYLVFTILLGGAFYYLYQSRARELVSDRDRAHSEREAAVRRADEATARLVARESADNRAWEIYQLLTAGNREAAAKRLAELRDAPVSKLEREVLTDRAKQMDVLVIDTAIKNALTSFKAGRFGEVIKPLEAALKVESTGPNAAKMHYLIGIALSKANELEPAIAHLKTSLEMDVADLDARFQLASALDRAGQWGKARTEYDQFATAHPQSGLAVFAMRRSATLARMPAVAPVPGQAPAAVAPAPVAPAAVAPAPVAPAPPRPVPAPGAVPTPQPALKPKAPPVPKPTADTADPFAPAPAPAQPPAESPAAPATDGN